MKVKNLHIYGDSEKINRLYDEYIWIGRNDVRKVDSNHLVVYALPRKRERRKKDDNKDEQNKPRRHAKGYHNKRNRKTVEVNDE